MRVRLLLGLIVLTASLAQAQPVNYCLDLNGKTAGAKIEQINGLKSLNGATRYTFEAWVRPRTQGGSGRGRILDQVTSSLTFYLSDEGRIGFRPNREVGWQLSNPNSIQFWTWQHVAVTSDGNMLRFFVNGRLLTAIPTNTKLDVTRKAVHVGNGIGQDSTHRGFDGWLDEIRVSDVCLWTADFTPPARSIFNPPDASTVLYLTFDEGPAYDVALDYSTYNTEMKIEKPLLRVRAPK